MPMVMSLLLSVLQPGVETDTVWKQSWGETMAPLSLFFKRSTFSTNSHSHVDITNIKRMQIGRESKTPELRHGAHVLVPAPNLDSALRSQDPATPLSACTGRDIWVSKTRMHPFKERMLLTGLRGKSRSCQPVSQTCSNPRPCWYLRGCRRSGKPDSVGHTPFENILWEVSGGSNRSARKSGPTTECVHTRVTVMRVHGRRPLSHAFPLTLTSLEHSKMYETMFLAQSFGKDGKRKAHSGQLWIIRMKLSEWYPRYLDIELGFFIHCQLALQCAAAK